MTSFRYQRPVRASDASDASDPSDEVSDASDAADTSDATDPSDASDASDATDPSDSNDDGCNGSSFEGATQSFETTASFINLTQFVQQMMPTNDVLTLEFYDGLPTAGSSLNSPERVNADCSTCLYLQLGGNTERAFLAISGVLTIDTVSETTITGSFSNVVLGQTTTPFGSSATFC